MINCPSCGSSHVVKDGIRLTAYGETQRYLCKVCYVRFSLGDNIVVKKPSRVGLTSVMGSQVCAILQEAKNLNNATIEKVAGDKPKQNAILEYAWSMKKQGLATSTISNRVRGLNRLISLGAQLESTSSVETVLATETFTCSVKLELVRIYKAYCSCHGIIWKPTNIVKGREQRVWKEAPSPDRWKKRSRTFPGIAEAMAEQWGNLLEK